MTSIQNGVYFWLKISLVLAETRHSGASKLLGGKQHLSIPAINLRRLSRARTHGKLTDGRRLAKADSARVPIFAVAA